MIVLLVLALNTLTSFKLLEIGDLLNLDRAYLRCLIASLQSSLYHELLLVGFVEVWGIHSLDISIREDVKSDIGSEDSLKFSGIYLPVQRVLNRSQLALFNFHFGFWSYGGKSVLFNDDREVITIVLVFTYRPIIIKIQ